MTEPATQTVDHGQLVQDGSHSRPAITVVSWRADPDLTFRSGSDRDESSD